MKKAILIILVFISTASCRTAKKEWVKENFASHLELEGVKNTLSEELKKQEASLTENIQSKYKEVLDQKSSEEISNESEDSTISGTIIAEDGKEKSVSYGGTTISSNGATIKFTSKITKALSKEYSSKFQELNNQLDQERKTVETLSSEINTIKKELEHIKSTQDIDRKSKSRDVKSNGFQLVAWVWLGLLIIVIVLLNIFKNQIPFINNILK